MGPIIPCLQQALLRSFRDPGGSRHSSRTLEAVFPKRRRHLLLGERLVHHARLVVMWHAPRAAETLEDFEAIQTAASSDS